VGPGRARERDLHTWPGLAFRRNVAGPAWGRWERDCTFPELPGAGGRGTAPSPSSPGPVGEGLCLPRAPRGRWERDCTFPELPGAGGRGTAPSPSSPGPVGEGLCLPRAPQEAPAGFGFFWAGGDVPDSAMGLGMTLDGLVARRRQTCFGWERSGSPSAPTHGETPLPHPALGLPARGAFTMESGADPASWEIAINTAQKGFGEEQFCLVEGQSTCPLRRQPTGISLASERESQHRRGVGSEPGLTSRHLFGVAGPSEA